MLCAVVLAVELSELLTEEIDIKIDKTTFYTDSKVVSSQPDDWRYVSTEHNPADHGSRSVAAGKLASTTWLCGPAFLLQPESTTPEKFPFELIDPQSDVEIHSNVTVLATTVSTNHLGSACFERFSKWTPLISAVAHLRHISHTFNKCREDTSCAGWHLCKTSLTGRALSQAEHSDQMCPA